MASELSFIPRRLAALTASPLFRFGPPAELRLRALWRRLMALESEARGPASGAWHLVAALDPSPWFGESTTIVFADRDRADPQALADLVSALRGPGLHRRPDTWLEIDPRDEGLLAALLADGWWIDSVISVGGIDAALRRRDHLATDGGADVVAFEPLEAVDLDAVVALQGRTFQAEPWWCWFGAYPDHLTGVAEDIAAWVDGARPDSRHWVLRKGEAIVGHLSLDVSDEPFWGRAAGVGIVLAPELRGRGYLKRAYGLVLEVSQELGARVWKGGTAQPAVMSLSRRLGRVWHQIGLRRQGRFAASHFMAFAPSPHE